MITNNDRAILRNLAKKQLELANSQKNKEIINEWFRHRRLERGRPMVHLELWTFQKDVIPKRLKCETKIARDIESSLYSNFLNQEIFNDDKPIPDYYPICWRLSFKPFDIDIKTVHAMEDGKETVGYKMEHMVKDLLDDYHLLKPSTYEVDKKGTIEYRDLVEDIFGDILPTKMTMGSLGAVPTQKIIHLMGMENFFFAMYDYPELVKEMMNRLANDYISYFKWLESENLLLPQSKESHLGQGTFCFTDDLKNQQNPTSTHDLWGFMDSQETVGISKEMFKEFIFPCYKKVSSLFGLFSYGCCEPVDTIWDGLLDQLDNLRNVSISPWCNEEIMGEKLRNSKIIYHRKPSPNFIGVDRKLDEEAFRAHIKKTVEASKGCQLEFAQRDVYTIHEDEEKARRYIEIIREEGSMHK